MDCEEMLEDVIAFCKKEIEAIERRTKPATSDGYDSLNTLRGLRDADDNVIDRIATNAPKNNGSSGGSCESNPPTAYTR